MVHGLNDARDKRKKYKTRLERDVDLHHDLIEAYYQKGKAMGDISNKIFSKKEKKNQEK
jgi:hypothetical protein